MRNCSIIVVMYFLVYFICCFSYQRKDRNGDFSYGCSSAIVVLFALHAWLVERYHMPFFLFDNSNYLASRFFLFFYMLLFWLRIDKIWLDLKTLPRTRLLFLFLIKSNDQTWPELISTSLTCTLHSGCSGTTSPAQHPGLALNQTCNLILTQKNSTVTLKLFFLTIIEN